MNYDKITLNNGYEIAIQELYYRHTYSDMLAGVPNNKFNKFILNSLITRVRDVFCAHPCKIRKYPIYLKEPEITNEKMCGEIENFLPDTMIACEADNYTSKKFKDFCGSSLIIIIFTNHKLKDKPIIEIIEEQIKDLDWDTFAEGYDL